MKIKNEIANVIHATVETAVIVGVFFLAASQLGFFVGGMAAVFAAWTMR